MKIKRNYVIESTLEDFADKHDLTMLVNERGGDWKNTDGRYYARFESCKVKEGCMLSSTFGNGGTETEAIENYKSQISEKLIVINAYTPNRTEINVPRLV